MTLLTALIILHCTLMPASLRRSQITRYKTSFQGPLYFCTCTLIFTFTSTNSAGGTRIIKMTAAAEEAGSRSWAKMALSGSVGEGYQYFRSALRYEALYRISIAYSSTYRNTTIQIRKPARFASSKKTCQLQSLHNVRFLLYRKGRKQKHVLQTSYYPAREVIC